MTPGTHLIGLDGQPYGLQASSGTTGPGLLIIGHSCGARLLRETETVALVPIPNGVRVHFYFIDRLGHALVYFLY